MNFRNNRDNSLSDNGNDSSSNPYLLHLFDNIRRYQRNIEVYNNNIEDYNTNFRRIIPLLHNLTTPPTQTSPSLFSPNQVPPLFQTSQTPLFPPTPTQTESFEFVTYTPSTSNIASILLSLLDPSGSTQNRGLSETDISANTTVYDYSEEMDSGERTLCPITMEPLNNGDQVMKITRCNHKFKEAALRRWFQNNRTCPVCRQAVNMYW